MAQQGVIMQQPGMMMQPMAPQQPQLRDWNSGLFSCFDDFGGCLFGYFCSPCLACSVSKRLGENSCLPLCVPGGLLGLRVKLRTIYGIRGDMCSEGCCTLQFCGSCALCQMDRELKAMGVA